MAQIFIKSLENLTTIFSNMKIVDRLEFPEFQRLEIPYYHFKFVKVKTKVSKNQKLCHLFKDNSS